MKFSHEVFLIFVLPVILRIFLPEIFTLPILLIVTLIVILICFKKQISLKELGIRTDNLKESFTPYLYFTLFAFFVIAFLHDFLSLPLQNISSDRHFYGIFIIVSFSQEFLYRSYLVKRSKEYFKKDRNIAFLNAFLFGLIHTVFASPAIMFIISFIAGYIFTLIYLKHPNYWLISISHSFLNFVAVWLGLFIF